MDSAEPSTNGISAQNLYRLGSMLHDLKYTERGRETCLAFEAEILQHPFLFSSMVPAIVAEMLGVRGVVLIGGASRENTKNTSPRTLGRLETTVRVKTEMEGKKSWLSERNLLIKSLLSSEGAGKERPRVLICEGGSCREEVGGGKGT